MKYTIITALALAGLTACSETNKQGVASADADTAVLLSNDITTNNDNQPGETGTASDDANWNDIDYVSLPATRDPDVTDRDVDVRSNDDAAVYSVGENLLFDFDKSELRPNADAKLKQIITSINRRYAGGRVKVYGFADAVGDKDYNKELSERRAEAVRQYLKTEGNLTDERITVHAMGEQNPVGDNSTAAGRQKNRRVSIVARKR